MFVGTEDMAKEFFKNLSKHEIAKYDGEKARFRAKKGNLAAYPFLYAVSMYGDVKFCPFTKEYSASFLKDAFNMLGKCEKAYEKTEKVFYSELYLSKEEAEAKRDEIYGRDDEVER